MTAPGHTSTPTSGEPRPRIWRCPVGRLAYLPLHAAGPYATSIPAIPRTVPDLAISSYTPTVRALDQARARHGDPAATATVVISVPDAPCEQQPHALHRAHQDPPRPAIRQPSVWAAHVHARA